MAKTKQTQRKPITILCPQCKDKIERNDFIKHLDNCRNDRYACQVCGNSYKRSEYLKKHVKRQHAPKPKQDQKPQTQSETSTATAPCTSESKSKAESSTCDYDFTDFAPDEDLNIIESSDESSDESEGRSSDKSKEESGCSDSTRNEKSTEKDVSLIEIKTINKGNKTEDTRVIQDIRSGRIYRKRTLPAPIPTPERSKVVVERVETSKCNDTETKKKYPEQESYASGNEEVYIPNAADSDKLRESDTHAVRPDVSNTVSDFSLEQERLRIESQKIELEKARIESAERQKREEREFKANMIEKLMSIIKD